MMSFFLRSFGVAMISIFGFLLFGNIPVSAQYAESLPVDLYFFRGEGCPHCAEEEIFLEELQKDYPSLRVHSYEVWYNAENQALLQKIERATKADIRGVPVTMISSKILSGFLDKNTSGKAIRDQVDTCTKTFCPDVIGELIGRTDPEPVSEPDPEDAVVTSTDDLDQDAVTTTAIADDTASQDSDLSVQYTLPETLSLPWIGEIRIAAVSLPFLTVVIGLLDGFNPCAMWALLFLIPLLLGMNARRRMWLLGGAFILASGAVYFMFLSAWLNLVLFIGFIFWVRILIGLVALGGGGYNLYEYFTNQGGTCKVTNTEKRQRIFAKLRSITQVPSFWLALFGIVLLAVAVNMVELVCSAGLPAVYTQILALNNLPIWQYYGYLLLYILFFMLDDMIVFSIAMVTLRVTGLSTKYTHYSHLIGGVLMLLIGLALIFKPGLLMFG